MTLCQKLEELGYKYNNRILRCSKHYYDIEISVCICLKTTEQEINYYGVIPQYELNQQEDIDKMQVAFNRLKKDIKEIEKWQKQIANLSK